MRFNMDKELPDLKGTNFDKKILKFRNIENPELFLNHNNNIDKITTDPREFYNIEKSLNFLDKINIEKLKVGILVDDDADGFSSAAVLTKFLKMYCFNAESFTPIFHDQKSHGLKGEVNKILKSKVDIIFTPDSSSNDFDEVLELLNNNISVFIIDHHEIDDEERIYKMSEDYNNFMIINNELSRNGNVNKNFVGCGMVLELVKYVDILDKSEYSNVLMDISAMGQIGDSSDISDYEIHHIVRNGIENLTSPLLKEVFKTQLHELEKVSPMNLSFKIIPLINSVTRVGTVEDKGELFEALIGTWSETELVTIDKRRKNKQTGKFNIVQEEWSPYEIELEKLTKIKAKQNKEVTKIEKLSSDTAFLEKICIVELSNEDIEHRSISGLIATKLCNKFQRPTLVLIDNEDGTFGGSGRGWEKTFKDFRKYCLRTNLFELAQGHDNAFGVIITKDNLILLKEKLIKKSEETNEEIVYNVDKIYENESNINEIIQINDNGQLFGGKVGVPIFGYKNLILNRTCLSQRGTVITFWDKGLEFIAYRQEIGTIDNFIAKMGFNQFVKVNLVGTPSRSDFGGRLKEQIILTDFDFDIFIEEKAEEIGDIINGNVIF